MLQRVPPGDMFRPEATVQIGSMSVDVTTLSMSRELSDSLPGSGVFTAASGELTGTVGADTASTVVTPWDLGTQWPPVQEAAASVSWDMGLGPVPALTNGRVTGSDGGSSSREVGVGISDGYASLDRSISWDPLMYSMPSLEENQNFRHVGLQSAHVTDRILRHCGWYVTPPRSSGVLMSATMIGSTWPEVGTVIESHRYGDSLLLPQFVHAPWGLAVQDVKAVYLPSAGMAISTRGIEVTAMMPPDSASMYVKLYAGGRQFILSWSGLRVTLTAELAVGSQVELVSLPRGAARTVAARFERTSAGMVRGLLRLDDGSEATGSPVAMDNVALTSAVDEIQVLGTSQVGAVQVAAPASPWAVVDYTPTAVLHPRAGMRNVLDVIPAVESENCADLLAQQCEAECATFWIDETGVLQWWDLARLDAQSPVATMNSEDHIADAGFAWSHEFSSVKSRVLVEWKSPAIYRSYNARVDLWQGTGETLESGEPVEDWITTPADEIWIMPDLSFSVVGTSSAALFNRGIDSWFGAVVDDTETWAHNLGDFTFAVEKVTGAAYKYRMSWVGSGQAICKTQSERATSDLWIRHRNVNLPILRGKAKATLVDMTSRSAQVGPASAAEHRINAGWWIQSEEQAQYTADYAGARVTVPAPVLSSIEMIPVPGLQLGDVVTVVDTHVTRLTIRGVVVRISWQIDAGGGFAQSIAVRPTYVTRNGITWQQWSTAIQPQTWTGWSAGQNGKTWQAWGISPLLGEESNG